MNENLTICKVVSFDLINNKETQSNELSMSVRIHLKELIYLSIATTILLIFIWHLNFDTKTVNKRFKEINSNFYFNQDIYKVEKVKINLLVYFLS